MSDVIQILQLGSENWNDKYKLPGSVRLIFESEHTENPKMEFDLVFIDKEISDAEIALLMDVTKAYTLFVTEHVELTGNMKKYYDCRKGRHIAEADIQDFLLQETGNFFPKPYGEKFSLGKLSIAQGFAGSVEWQGNYCVSVSGEFGEELSQIAYWRNNIPIFQGQAIEMWLEYEKDPEVEIALSITQFKNATISEVQQKWYFTEKDLDEMVIVDNQMATGPVFVSLLAKGSGTLKIIALHDRYSRRGQGIFLPGGARYVAPNREEILYYFNPGDMKPPLNVYFSGYKTMQSFEGYYMMKSFNSPFLLISESRLTGGSFYMGNEEYEKGFVSIIQKHLDELGFSNDQLILSGISMGSLAALYYGCDLLPHAMIVGKPLASIGDVALNERLHRPGGFPTSLDVLNYLSGATNDKAIEVLNDKFWDKFDSTDWGESKFIVSYMIEDDYDCNAYNNMISHLKATGVQVYGKGIHGRHNDESRGIVNWFKSQYEKILKEDFLRG